MHDAPHELWPFAFGAAIFDFDGTLAHTANIWHEVDATFLSRRGLPLLPEYPERLAALGFEGGAQYTIDLFGLSETVEEICYEWNQLGQDLYRESVALRPGAQEYLVALRAAGIPCALATTNDRSVLECMRLVDVGSLFDACVYAREVGRSKEHPHIYLSAARQLGVEPSACVVFEDIPVALGSARRAGMCACGVRANDPMQDVDAVRAASDLWLDDWRAIPYDA